MRVAIETGYDDSPQPGDWLKAKAVRIEAAVKALCHYGSGGSSLNSCCGNNLVCRSAVDAAVRIQFGTKKNRPAWSIGDLS